MGPSGHSCAFSMVLFKIFSCAAVEDDGIDVRPHCIADCDQMTSGASGAQGTFWGMGIGE